MVVTGVARKVSAKSPAAGASGTVRSRQPSGPINAIFFDRQYGTMWGGASHHGEDYGIAW